MAVAPRRLLVRQEPAALKATQEGADLPAVVQERTGGEARERGQRRVALLAGELHPLAAGAGAPDERPGERFG